MITLEIINQFILFSYACNKFGDRRCFAERKKDEKGNLGDFEWISYNDFKGLVENMFQGLCEIGVKSGKPIGIFSKNRLEWAVVQCASFLQSNVIVSFYETLGVDSLAFVSEHAEIELAFCSRATFDKTLEIAKSVKILKTIICFDSVTDQERSQCKDLGFTLYTYSDLLKLGEKANGKHKHQPPSPDTLATIMYTSGTTGNPKGAMITHKNLTSVISSVHNYYHIHDTDCHYSYLPFAHILERVIVLGVFHFGGGIGIFSGDIANVLTEVKALKPTLFIGVPRIYERIKAGVYKELDKKPKLVKTLFNLAYKLKYYSIYYGFKLPLIENLLNLIFFNKVKSQLGGRVRIMLSGAAPLSTDTEIFLRAGFCCDVVQGYGLTESCGGTCVKLPEDESFGTTGPPFDSVEIKLVDVPELNYFANSEVPSGEICLRGHSIFIGYYKDPEKTKEDLRDGWFYTGDIGRWNKDGSLSIIDRKKNIFKLSQGEYIAVEKIESSLTKSNWVAQICIYGNSQKSSIIAIIHPHQDKSEEWGKSKKNDKSFKEICKDEEFKKVILDDLNKVGREAKLFGFELPKTVILTDEPFSENNDLMTPSFKLKRPQIKEYFKKEIDHAYSTLD
eukprot:gene7904-9725_t